MKLLLVLLCAGLLVLFVSWALVAVGAKADKRIKKILNNNKKR